MLPLSQAVFAILFPGLVSALWIRSFVLREPTGDWSIALGYGYFMGLFATVGLLLLWDGLGLGLHAPLTLLVWIALLLIWLVVHGRAGWAGLAAFRPRLKAVSLRGWQGWVWWLLLALLLFRLGVLAAEGFWRPLTPWDAWVVWIHRAELWAQSGTLLPFVARDEWLHGVVPGAYTIDAHHYPKTVSLIPVWVALLAGGWNEDLVLLPWLGALVALLIGLYGQVRRQGGEPWAAMLLVYAIGSLPLIASHTGLYGYADLWIAATLALAAVALWSAREPAGARWLLLAFPMLLMLPALKVEGWVWLLAVAIGWAAGWATGWAVGGLRTRARWITFASVAVLLPAGLVAFWLGGGSLSVPGLGEVVVSTERLSVPGLFTVELGYHPDALAALAYALFAGESWHLFWFVFWPVLLLGMIRCAGVPQARTAVWTLFVATALLAFLFLFTQVSAWVVSFSVVNRLLLHFVPLGAFVVWRVLHCVAQRHAGMRPAKEPVGLGCP